jgi:hypothetical protein
MALEFKRGGRKVSLDKFMDGVKDDLIERAMMTYGDDLHGKASSVVDPETGKHAPVFVRRIGNQGWSIHTSGSSAFARALEQRLGLTKGEVHGMSEPAEQTRKVYLAHASEDKAIARPIADGLMARGIEVWFDEWEIGAGDSLRRKMEQGLEDCTHFVVLLTSTSIQKSWVAEEIDVGLMSAVEGTARFMGLRYDLPLSALSPFLRTRLSPEFHPGDAGLDSLAGDIFGVSKKPPLGEKPRYVNQHQPGSSWSSSARSVAEYFVRNSEHAAPLDPQATYAQIQEVTGLPRNDVRIGVLDLIGAGLLERQEYLGSEADIWPKSDLFVTFDAEFMDWDPEADGRSLANHLANLNEDQADAADAAATLGWEPRRFNAAAAFLVTARIVQPVEHLGGDSYWPCGFLMGDELLRFVRNS